MDDAVDYYTANPDVNQNTIKDYLEEKPSVGTIDWDKVDELLNNLKSGKPLDGKDENPAPTEGTKLRRQQIAAYLETYFNGIKLYGFG